MRELDFHDEPSFRDDEQAPKSAGTMRPPIRLSDLQARHGSPPTFDALRWKEMTNRWWK